MTAEPANLLQTHRPLEDTVHDLLLHLGEDPQREGLLKTPRRVAESMRFLTKGYDEDVDEVINGAVFEEAGAGLVLVKDIQFYSLCEHHLLPFFGKAHVAYQPRGHILGLSKLARVVEIFARRLQVQERLTSQVGDTLDRVLAPLGVAVLMEATHLCMVMRGVEKSDSLTTTTFRSGVFEGAEAWSDFLSLCRR
jgi:GTP cyclohydrolase IA